MMLRLNAQQLRDWQPTEQELAAVKAVRREIYLMAVDVYDTYNIGGLFRLADAVGVKKLYLCGRSECPPNSRITKASVSTDRWIDWEYSQSAKDVIVRIRNQESGITVLGIEQSEESVGLSEIKMNLPVLLVVGSETAGLSADILAECDQIVELQMYGINRSMNVIVSAAMVLGRLING